MRAKLAICAAAAVCSLSALAAWDTMFTKLNVIPRPREIVEKEGHYVVKAEKVTAALASFTVDESVKKEGYRMSVTKDGIAVRHADAAGAFYAVETLKQLAIPQVGGQIAFPCCELDDWPEYSWRGVHIDDCRHFMGKETIRLTLDLMAMHKMNVLHWHLTDDQGWRIDVPGYPELVKYGAVRPYSPRHGERANELTPEGADVYNTDPYGPFFYTRADLEEIIAYARARHILVMPEIEIPGHMRAALAAYPEFSCKGKGLKPRHPWCKWGISEDVLCVGNDEAMAFLEKVFDYVCDVFDSPFIHIGGDECPTTRWHECPKCQAKMKALGLVKERDLQGYVTGRFADYLAKKGRRIFGWDEVLESKVPQSAVILSWRGAKGAQEAAKRGNDTVMAAGFYFDGAQGIKDDPFEYIGGYQPIEAVFGVDPAAGVPDDQKKHVLGAECCNWSEYTWGRYDLQWKMWPRTCALAENLWTKPEDPYNGRWPFMKRVWVQCERLRKMGVNCATVR